MVASNIVDFFSTFNSHHLPKLPFGWLMPTKLCADVGAYKIEKMLRPEEALI